MKDWGVVSVLISILGVTLHSSYRLGKMQLKLDLLWQWFQKEHDIKGE